MQAELAQASRKAPQIWPRPAPRWSNPHQFWLTSPDPWDLVASSPGRALSQNVAERAGSGLWRRGDARTHSTCSKGGARRKLVRTAPCHEGYSMDVIREDGTIQSRSAWPLHKDTMHTSRKLHRCPMIILASCRQHSATVRATFNAAMRCLAARWQLTACSSASLLPHSRVASSWIGRRR